MDGLHQGEGWENALTCTRHHMYGMYGFFVIHKVNTIPKEESWLKRHFGFFEKQTKERRWVVSHLFVVVFTWPLVEWRGSE